MQRFWRWVLMHKAQVGAVGFWVAVILATRTYMNVNDYTFLEFTERLVDLLRATWYGPLIYIIVYLLRPLILFPASLLTILAGSVFGLVFGFIYALLAGTLSAAMPYAIGRWFSNDSPDEISQEGGSVFSRFVAMMQRNPFQSVLMMRLLYLPYDAVSLVAGSMRIPFIMFFLATALGNVGGTFAFIGVGASVEGDFASGDVTLNPAVLIFSVAVLIISLGVSRILSARQAKSETPRQVDLEPSS